MSEADAMIQRLSERVLSLKESETIKMAAMAREMKQRGVDVINLSLGEPDFETPLHIRAAAKTAIDEGHSHYPPVPGYLQLREAICAKFRRDNHLDYTPSQIVVSTGAKQSLANLVLALVNPGDEVVTPAPYWVSYAAQVQLAEGTLITIPTSVENNFKITPEQLEASLANDASVFIFSSPCNPTGAFYTRRELEQLVRVFDNYPDVFVISDEIYEYMNFEYDHVSIAEIGAMQERTAIVNGISKSFAMTGWRLGYMAGPKWLADACNKIQGQFTSGTSTISQMAAIEALTSPLDATLQMKEAFRKRRNIVLDAVQKIPGLKSNRPEGAFYVFPDVSSYFGMTIRGQVIQNAEDLCMAMLQHAHVATVPGDAFGEPRCIRISYAASDDQLKIALERMAAFFQELQ
jgi:aspartate aminotransferase